MATIFFKGKVKTMYAVGDIPLYQYIDIPVLKKHHCDMNAFRSHPKYGSWANSDMFLGILNHIKTETFKGKSYVRLDMLPENVTVDTSGFLAEVIITV